MYNNNSLIGKYCFQKANLGDLSTIAIGTPVYSDVKIDYRPPFMFVLDFTSSYSAMTVNDKIKFTGEFQYAKNQASLKADGWKEMLTFSNQDNYNAVVMTKDKLTSVGKDNFQFTVAHAYNPNPMSVDMVIFVRIKTELLSGVAPSLNPVAFLVSNNAMNKFENNNPVNNQ